MSYRVLFVCLGNICRSPTADAVFAKLLRDAGLEQQIEVDSAGTGDWHIGHTPDERMQAAAEKRGYSLAKLRARQVEMADFRNFDLILGMDQQNMADLRELRPADAKAELALFLSYAPASAELGDELDVPDPYYGGEQGFDEVIDLVELASLELLTAILQQEHSRSALNIQHDVDLSTLNTMATSARAAHFVDIDSVAELVEAVGLAQQEGWPVLVLGAGSNTVFVDDYPGLVMHVCLRGIHCEEQGSDRMLAVAAGENWDALVRHCLEQGWYGLENLRAIPGTVGAAPIQNIGAYGVELSSVLQSVTGWDIELGSMRKIDVENCELAYRHSIFKASLRDRFIITSVSLKLSSVATAVCDYPALRDALPADTDITPRLLADTVAKVRASKLPDYTQEPNSGSFFKNPIVSAELAASLLQKHPEMPHWPMADGQQKFAAAWLVDQAGWKGVRRGGVGIHPNHAIVMVNYEGASGAEILAFATEIQQDVLDKFSVQLDIEPTVVVTAPAKH